MASINKVILVGNLGADPEIRTGSSGAQIATVSMATTERRTDKFTGERREDTEWHRVVFFGRLAEVVGQYLAKGSSIYVEGKLRTRKWQGQDGRDRYTTEIVADEMQMLGRAERGQTSSPQGTYQATRHFQPQSTSLTDFDESVIPF